MDRYVCCTASACREGRKCRITLPISEDVLCLSGTKLQDHHAELSTDPLCDCIVAWTTDGRDVGAGVELKSGGVDVSHAVDQLQNGAHLLHRCGRGTGVFAAVLATNGKLRAIEINKLRRLRVTIRGKKHSVILARCGGDLERVLVDHGYL